MSDLATIIIDMQEYFLKDIDSNRRTSLVVNQLKLIDYSVTRKIPILAVEYIDKSIDLGNTIPVLKNKLDSCNLVSYYTKDKCNAFSDDKFSSFLKNLNVNKLIMSGVYANACVNETAIYASAKDYLIYVSDDLMCMNNFDFKKYSKFSHRKKSFKCYYEYDGRIFGNISKIRYYRNYDTLIENLNVFRSK